MLEAEPVMVPFAEAPPCDAAPSRMPAEILVSTLALAACGGGGSTPSGGSTGAAPPSPPPAAPPPSPPPPVISDTQASRFLAQSAMGGSRADIAEVVSLGYAGWLDAQFAKPRGTPLWDYLVAQGYNTVTYRDGETGFDPALWRALLAEPDQLRQRVAMALLEIMVVGISGVNVSWRQFAVGAYVDILFDNAFGNFRTLLDKITTNVAMGSFLTFLGNKKASASGSVPDENYARELMQLFTIGLRQLNADGTEKAPAQDTYVPADVSGLARVFTGLTYDSADNSTPDRLRRPMVYVASNHETGVSTFLGATVPAGTDGAGAVKIALDTIFAHPNVAPFIARQLIQRLVTSNPSAAYVGRVSAVFANNGSGVRGDLKATVRALLLDDEARTVPTGANVGKLREPVMRLTSWARAFGATSPSNAWAIGDTSSQNNRLGESAGRSPSVFNWWRPGYTPAGTTISAAGLVAPEFQATNEVSTIAYINFMQTLIQTGMGDFKADYTAITAKAGDSAALMDEINVLLAAGQLSAATIATIRGAVDAIAATQTANRVYTAILLTMASPDYLVLR